MMLHHALNGMQVPQGREEWEGYGIDVGVVDVADSLLAAEDARLSGQFNGALSVAEGTSATITAAMEDFSYQAHVSLGLLNIHQRRLEVGMVIQAERNRDSVLAQRRANHLVKEMAREAGSWFQSPEGVVSTRTVSPPSQKPRIVPRYMEPKQEGPRVSEARLAARRALEDLRASDALRASLGLSAPPSPRQGDEAEVLTGTLGEAATAAHGLKAGGGPRGLVFQEPDHYAGLNDVDWWPEEEEEEEEEEDDTPASSSPAAPSVPARIPLSERHRRSSDGTSRRAALEANTLRRTDDNYRAPFRPGGCASNDPVPAARAMSPLPGPRRIGPSMSIRGPREEDETEVEGEDEDDGSNMPARPLPRDVPVTNLTLAGLTPHPNFGYGSQMGLEVEIPAVRDVFPGAKRQLTQSPSIYRPLAQGTTSTQRTVQPTLMVQSVLGVGPRVTAAAGHLAEAPRGLFAALSQSQHYRADSIPWHQEGLKASFAAVRAAVRVIKAGSEGGAMGGVNLEYEGNDAPRGALGLEGNAAAARSVLAVASRQQSGIA